MKLLKKLLLVSFCLTLAMPALFGCAVSDNDTALTDDEKAALLEDAYVYTLPLMMMDATAVKMTNTVAATANQAPYNQICHAEKLADASFRNVVTPNVDTIYSQMMLDLSENAVILELPKTDRFCTAQMLDAYTNCVTVIDASEFEAERETYIFTGSNFDGEIPEGMTQIKYPTSLGWMIIRTICYDKADEANVHAIQSQMKAYTLSQYNAGKTEEFPQGTFSAENNFVPSEHVLHLSMEEYFTRANALMTANPPTEADAPMMKQLAKINVGPGLTFDPAVFGENAKEQWVQLVSNIANTSMQNSLQFFTKNGNWSYMGKPIAEFGTEYDYRAFISIFGLGANPVSIAVYPKTDIDSDGETLTGKQNYVLHFEKDQLPPVEGYGFWSVTAYDSDNFLIDNEIDRYCINNRSDVVYNEDGSLDIYIQAEKPEQNEANWLPVDEGDFHLVLRIYMPDESVVTNQWPTPVLKKNA